MGTQHSVDPWKVKGGSQTLSKTIRVGNSGIFRIISQTLARVGIQITFPKDVLRASL